MKWRKTLIAAFLGMTMMTGNAFAQVSYQHVRNATGKLAYNDTVFLIDPMLAEKGRYEGFAGSFNSEVRNPKMDLPESKEDVLKNVDALIVTHTHLDHWEEVAQQFINKDIPVFVQDDKDATEIRKEGFRNVQVLNRDIEFQGVRLTRVEGTHGTEEMYANPAYSVLLGESMGVVFAAPGEKTTYLMGDTVWTARVDKTLQNRQPDILIMNTGYAKSICYNDSIIMGTEDVGRAATRMPKAKIVAVHMDAINHCTVSRKNMRDFVHSRKLGKQVAVPDDGQIINFDK